MESEVTFNSVAALANQLSPSDRLRLVQQITTDLAASQPTDRRHWSEIRGIVSYPMCGDDAQEWLSRTRQEADKQREMQWRGA